MQPSSLSFLVLISVLTLLAIGATVLTWDWHRFKLARRFIALTVTQAMVVMSVLVGVNTHEYFFVSWNEIFAGVDDSVAADAGPIIVGPAAKERSATAPTDPIARAVAAGQRYAASHPGRGVMVGTTIRGAQTGYSLPARLYLPAAYFDRSQPDRTFPVIEFFTGFVGGIDIFQRRMGANSVMDDLISRGKLPPTIVVIPTQNMERLKDSECVDAVRGARADTYVASDVPDAVRAGLRVSPDRAQWALMGYSTGGFCAVNLALRHSDRFGAAVSLSGYFNAAVDQSTGDLYKGDAAVKLANTPKHTISARRPYPLRFYLFTASQDREGAPAIKDFAPRVLPPDRVTVVAKDNGGHNFGVWIRALPETFSWLGTVFREAAAVRDGEDDDPAPDPEATPTPTATPTPSTSASPTPSTSASPLVPLDPALVRPDGDPATNVLDLPRPAPDPMDRQDRQDRR